MPLARRSGCAATACRARPRRWSSSRPVSLGAPAYKKLWPQAVWPGEISSAVPLAVNVKMADVNTSSVNDDGTVSRVSNDLQFPQEVNIFGAGTLGEHVSYFSEVTFGENPDGSVAVELEHARMGFDSPFGPEDLFHFRIGKFAPNLVDGFQEMWISTNAAIDSLFNYNPIGVNGGTGLGADALSPNPISLPARIRGIEGYGIINHRAMWVAGLANGVMAAPGDTTGRFDGNNAKDVYARFDYKIGGMGLDGDTGGQPIPEKNWHDNSLRLGVFTYRGDASGIPFALTTDAGAKVNIEDSHFLRTGILRERLLSGPERVRRLPPRDRRAEHHRRGNRRAAPRDRARLPRVVHAGRLRHLSVAAGIGTLRNGDAGRPGGAEHPHRDAQRERARAGERQSDGRVPNRYARHRQPLVQCPGPLRVLTRSRPLLGEDLCFVV